MGMVVKNNMSAVRTLNTLNRNSSALQSSLQRVSSGMKINSAQDDASGYAISERMRVRIRSLDQANQNTQNDSSLMKTAEGAVGNTVEILRALKEKAINAANDSNTDEDRQTIQKEINQFIDQIDDNALVQFNGKYLIDGSKNNAMYDTKTILLNQSLHTSTAMASALTDLKNRAGDSLGIQDTDKYQVSWVQNGEIHFTSGSVGSMDLATLLANATSTEAVATGSDGLIAEAKTEPDPNAPPKTLDDLGYSSAGTYDLSVDGTVYGAASWVDAGNSDADALQLDAANSLATKLAAAGIYKTAGDASTSYTAAEIVALGSSKSITGYAIQGADDADGNATTKAVSIDITYSTETRTNNGGQERGKYAVSIMDTDAGTALTGSVDLLYKAGGSGSTLTDAYDKFGKAVYTPDKTAGVAVASSSPGVQNQLSGLTICILDQDGNVKKAANAALDQFKQYQRAENKTGDMALNFHIGSEANVAIKVGMGDMRAEALGLKGANGQRIDVFTKEHANAAINAIENALTKALDQQTTIGAIESRLEYTSANLTTASENVQASESTIRDADMAKEMTNYTKNNVLLQAAQAMLAQANQASSSVLSLLQ